MLSTAFAPCSLVLFRSSKFKEFSLLESTVGGYANIFLVKGLKTALEMSILGVCAGFQLPNFLLDQDSLLSY